MKNHITRRTLLATVPAAAMAIHLQAAESDPATKNLFIEKTSDGDLAIQPINHSALRFEFKGKQYYIDPAGQADWANMPRADAILITHEHGDHLSPPTVDAIKKPGTVILTNESTARKAGFGDIFNIGETKQVLDVKVEAIPAYNMTADRLRFHPRERKDNGYILTVGGKRIYVAGDTEGTPEMKALKDIDVAFLPINLPYTMPPTEAADAARAFKPKILVPYHQGKSDPAEVKKLLADVKEIDVRVLALP